MLCGVDFVSIPGLNGPNIGRFWASLPAEFAQCDVLARPSPPLSIINTSVEPRVWLTEPTGIWLLQIQNDRMVLNWRRKGESTEYPRYKNIAAKFRTYLQALQTFLKAELMAEWQPTVLQICYVNQIPVPSGTEDFSDLFPDLTWRASGPRFLPSPEALALNASFALPGEFGRLFAAIKSPVQGLLGSCDHPVIQFELTIVGESRGGSDNEAIFTWFDDANIFINAAFVDLTGRAVRKDQKGGHAE